MKKITLFLFLLTALSSTTLFANDTAFGGHGSTPMPIKQNDIDMISEHIVIEGDGKGYTKSPEEETFNVTCLFKFKNQADKKVKIQMGFPLPVIDEESPVIIPKGYSTKTGDPLVHNFKVFIREKEVPTKRMDISPNADDRLYYDTAYIWETEFQPKEEIEIKHTYKTGATFDAMGHNWVSYVLKTGGMWKSGKIGHSLLEVIPNIPTIPCSQIAEGDHIKPKPKGMKMIGSKKNLKYVWDLKNYHPREDLDLCYKTGINFVTYNMELPISNGELNKDLEKLSSDDLRILRNTIYAKYGRTFKDSKLQKLFDSEWWYLPNKNYKDSMLTKEDKQVLKMIAKYEKK